MLPGRLHFNSSSGSIKHRLLTIFAVLGFGYLLLLSIVQFTAVATHQHLRQVSDSLFPAALKLHDAEADYERLQKRYKDAVLLEDRSALAAAVNDTAAVDNDLAELRRSLSSPVLEQQAEVLSARFLAVRSRSQTVYTAMVLAGNSLDGDLQAQAASLAEENRQLTADMQALDQSIAVQFRDELGAIDSWTVRSRLAGVVILLVAMAGCVVGWWVLHFQFVLPLEQLAWKFKNIAEGEGDLTARVEVRGQNEIDEAGRWFNVFIERIEDIVLRVSGNSRALTAAAQDLAATARANASRTVLQQEQATGITASMHEISAAVEQISRTTHSAAADARRAEQNAHSGGETIQSTVGTIQRVLTANQETASRIEALGGANEAIGKIVAVIDDIANQTSLLALNASIESARAGEHGRGFAVVAMEVRRLAERTSNATREIGSTVRAIQDGTAEVVEAMRSSMHHVESGVSSARSAGEALARIIRGSEAMQKMVTQIAAASSEQSAATQSVNENLNQIARISIETTESSTKAVRACDHVSALATDLNVLVGAFKVRSAVVSTNTQVEPGRAHPGRLAQQRTTAATAS